jgi:hypothetical protein
VVLEREGRASHVSTDAIRDAGSKTFYVTPDGSNKLEMSSQFVPAPGILNATGDTFASGGRRCFPTTTSIANGLTWSQVTLPYAATPYSTSQSIADNADQANADQTYVLVAAIFGASDGLVLEVDYAIVGEYIPDKNTPPGVESAVQTPNTGAMDAIFAAAAVIAELKPVLLQASGDRTQVASAGVPAGMQSEARRTRSVLHNAVRSHVGKIVQRTKPEGFWDSLARAAGSALSSIGTDLTDENPRVRGRK